MSEQKVVEIIDEAQAQRKRAEERKAQKEAEKRAKQESAYWNGVPTRREIKGIVDGFNGALAQMNQKIQETELTSVTLINVLVEKGIISDGDMVAMETELIRNSQEVERIMNERGDKTVEELIAEAEAINVRADYIQNYITDVMESIAKTAPPVEENHEVVPSETEE